MNRFHHKRSTSGEKKSSDLEGSPPLGGIPEDYESSKIDEETPDTRRRIFVNIPLPDDAKDEEGRPTANFGRNKIRTSKYTPLSFVPKNLWFQFHNIANIYFFFLVILTVSSPRL